MWYCANAVRNWESKSTCSTEDASVKISGRFHADIEDVKMQGKSMERKILTHKKQVGILKYGSSIEHVVNLIESSKS